MRLLLDTYPLLWWLTDDDKMRRDAGAAIIAPENDVSISVMSIWEIMIKARSGKLDLDLATTLDGIRREPFSRLNIADSHLGVLRDLPRHHKDPFDHLLIAQAISEDLIFVTRDAEAERYPVRLMRF